MQMLNIVFHAPDYSPAIPLTYVIIGARYKKRWVFIRHRKRNGFELAAGHIDKGELAEPAARRELMEETGALEYSLDCVAVYTVEEDSKIKAGRLYYADIRKIGEEYDREEIDEVCFFDDLPDDLTFPYIQRALFEKLKEYKHCKEIR